MEETNNQVAAIQKEFGAKIAEKAFQCGAIKLSPEKPFTWASGYKMPIYNDNRRLLAFPEMRKTICDAFSALAQAVDFNPDWIAGVATGGIPHGTTLADALELPFAYIRSESKDHGLKNQIEGLGADANFGEKNVLVIEDLISTGGSSIKAIQAVRAAHASAPYCFAIFSYGLDKAVAAFAGLSPMCTPISILNYDIMLETALAKGFITEKYLETLREWRKDPFNWWKE